MSAPSTVPAPGAAARLAGAIRGMWVARSFLTDRSAVVLAAAVVVGALRPVGVPVLVPLVLAAGAGVARRPVLVVLIAPVLAGALAHQALIGATPAAAGRIEATATLVSDPDDAFGSARAMVRADGHRYELRARGSASGQLRRALAGEVVSLAGRISPRRPSDEWLLTRHVIGHIDADRVQLVSRGDPVSRAANGFRRLLERGAESLDPATRALFTGFVLGDDRFQDPATVDAFRATGLSHLLVVSGQNVAFLLVVLRPVLVRIGLRPRFGLVVAALILFALLTRFEPSVLRATAMALIATLGTTLGRPIAPLRGLALAVVVLVLIDPLLVRAFGFQLSVAACAGIIVASRPLAERLPGPGAVAGLAAVTLSAQAFVAPLLMATPDGIPVAALPANLLAAPAAAPLMTWGLTGGVLAGIVGGPVAQVLHLPTVVLVWWVRAVSGFLAAVPLGRLGTAQLMALGAVVGSAWLSRRAGVAPAWRRWPAVLIGGAVVASAAVMPGAGPPGPSTALGPGAELWHTDAGAAVLVVDGRAQAGPVLGGLRAAGIRGLDVVICRTASRSAASVVGVVAERFGQVPVLAPEGSTVPGAIVPEGEVTAAWEGLELRVTPSRAGLLVDARTAGEAGVASPGAPPVARSRAPPALRAGSGRSAGAVAGRAPLRHRRPRRGHGHPQPDAGLVLRPGRLLGLRRVLAQG